MNTSAEGRCELYEIVYNDHLLPYSKTNRFSAKVPFVEGLKRVITLKTEHIRATNCIQPSFSVAIEKVSVSAMEAEVHLSDDFCSDLQV